MLLNKTFYQGQSLTIGVLIADTYDTANLQSSAIIVGEKKIASTVINQMLRFELSSEDTRNFITSKTVNLVIDDVYFGRREYPLGSLSFEKTKGQTIDGSIDEGYTVVFNATINEVAITIDSIMYDYVKGDKGDMEDLPAGVVIDPNYVHTDNNYTNADKAKVAGAIQAETDPTVPAWAKETTKPTYTASEVGAEPIKGSDDNYVTTAEKTKLSNLSGINTGDQDLSGLAPIYHTHPYEPANANIQNHISSNTNPHSVNKAQVGLGSVDNTSDLSKPISNATQTALNNKVDKVTGSSLVPDAEILANRNAVKKVTTLTTDGGQLTGFVDPIAVNVSYNGTTRKVTLTGDIRAAYKGIPMTDIIPSFVSGWQSEAHDIADGGYFLYFNGTNFVWSAVAWDFKQLMIASVYRDGVNFCLRECHGLMDWQIHQANHDNIGTYLKSGADVAGFTLNSDVATNRRPLISQALVYDEDLPTILPELTNRLYSRLFLDGANNANLENDKTDIVEYTAGNTFKYNLFTGGVWTKATAANNQYAKVFLMAVPVTSDAECQKNRYIWIMPQTVNATLTTIQNLTPANLSLGQISTALAEYVFVQEFIIRATSSGWTIVSTAKLTGNKRFQITTSGALATSHTALLDKNAEPSFQHLDTTTEKTTPIDADSFGLWDSVTSTFKRLSVANMLTWFRALPHTFTQMISFSGGVKTSKILPTSDAAGVVIRNADDTADVVNIRNGAVVINCTSEDNLLIKNNGSGNTMCTFQNDTWFRQIGFRYISGVGIDYQTYYDNSNLRKVDAFFGGAALIHKQNGSFGINIGYTDPKSMLHVNGGIKCADDTVAASIDKAGTTRYRADSNNSYTEMCMQVGASTYAWVIIKQNTW